MQANRFIFPARFALAVCSLLALVTPAAAAPVKFEIPAQPAPAALMEFSRQARVEVVFSADDLKSIRANEVVGEFEPEAALGLLLKDTGFNSRRNGGGKFVVTVAKRAERAGRVTGSVVTAMRGRPIAGVTVRIAGEDISTVTDARGAFALIAVPPGTHLLRISSETIVPAKITNVLVHPGETTRLDALEIPLPGSDGSLEMGELTVNASELGRGILRLEALEVVENRVTAFSDANVDIPRTINDPQPYYIFNQRTIEQSGATNIEGFLRERLTMSSSFTTNSQTNTMSAPFSQKTTSGFAMRGLDSQQVLILINGRRMAQLAQQGVDFQTDLNGVPLGAIDRIEVLPSSASGIYGGGAVSGVINIVLKRHYAGADLRVTYSNPFDTDSPTRSVDFTSGIALEGGRTNILLTAAWSDAKVLQARDRGPEYRANLARILANYPNLFTGFNMFVGTTPNIFAASGNITAIGSDRTYIPAGYRGFALDGLAPLVANAGRQNYEPAPTANYLTGLGQWMGSDPEVRSLNGTIRREMTSWLELFVEAGYRVNTGSAYSGNPSTIPITVAASAPTNPFGQSVRVAVPGPELWQQTSKSTSRSFSAGLTFKLPHGWQAQFDRSWNAFHTEGFSENLDTLAFRDAVQSGQVDPFRDTLLYGIDYSPYLNFRSLDGRSSLNETSLRAAGTIPGIPWFEPNIVASLSHRKEGRQDYNDRAVTTSGAVVFPFTIMGQSQSTDTAYLEATLPLVTSRNAMPGIQLLDVQLAGRSEAYTVRTTSLPSGGAGSSLRSYNPTNPPSSFTTYETKYTSMNPTIGARWQPVRDVMLRGSYATAFRPPTYGQLTPGNPSTFAFTVFDRRRGNTPTAVVPNPVGGNPDLTPERSKSVSAGLVFTPRWLDGFRFSVDYAWIEKRNNIGNLSPQVIVDNEASFPGRVTRGPVPLGDPYGVGPITGINTMLFNLHKQIIEAFDFAANYRRNARSFGTFDFSVLATYQPHFLQRTVLGGPLLEYSNTPSSGGVLKFRMNTQLTWDYKRWTLGWASQYYGSYKQLAPPLTTATTALLAQGSDMVSSQIYHDIFGRYTWPLPGADARGWQRWLGQTQLQIGIKNVFDKVPPFDANRGSTFFFSSYGDLRLRSYYVSLRRTF